jgi:hypothetical protein
LADRHKTKPKAVRMPDGLLAWYEEHAKATGRTVNASLVAALEEYRQRNSGSTTPPAVAPPKTIPVPAERLQELRTKALAADVEPIADVSELGRRSIEANCEQIAAQSRPPKNCKHPNLRLTKGVCPDCSEYVPSKS